MKKQKVLGVLLALAMVTGLCACGNAKDGSVPAKDSGVQTVTSEKTEAKEETKESEPVVLRVCDWSDSTAEARNKFHEEFMKNNPDIKIEYSCMTLDQFSNSVVLAISGGDAPDLFPVPSNMNLSTAVANDWFLPMQDYVSDKFIDSFMDGTLEEGKQRIDGVLYTVPENKGITHSLIFYNKDILAACGLDVPTTFDEFRNACKVVTEKGKGEYYGLIEGGNQANRCDVMLRAFAQAAGGKIAVSNEALTVGGVAPYNTAEVKMAAKLLSDIVADGSVYPDTPSIAAPEARELFAQGKAAFLMQGNWCIGTWDSTYPDFNYSVMAVPKASPNGYTAAGENGTWMGIYKQTKHPEAAARYIEALYDTETYSYQADVVSSGSYISVIKGVNEKYMTNETMKKYYEIANEGVAIPIATSRDSKFYEFYGVVTGTTPNLANICQGIFSKSITDIDGALDALSAAETENWKAGCELAGVDFEKLEFDNWVAGKPYTDADYAALK
ncbi:MAG: extracellular solute-binding protein [Lachnospiraceae bacterium]|nr:extracellular solute-binding protein [Lachnospiraceae bacterium]